MVNDAGPWTYGEMKDLSDRIARLLVEREGLVPGNRVFLRGPNNAMLFASWLGVLKAGGVVVTTMPMLRPGEIATILERARISHAIVDARFRADFDAAGGVGSVLTYDGDNGFDGLDEIAPGFTPVDTHRDDVALVAFTSGTTGKPKGCVHYHRDILAPADAFARHILKPEPGDRWACSAPIAFTFGLGMLLIFPWRFGGTAVTIETPGPKPLLDAIARHKVTILATAPTAYKAMIPLLAEHDISTPAHLRLGRRASPRRDLAGLARRDRPRHRRRHRRDRDDAHLHLRLGRRHPPRRHRQGRARLCRHRARRRRPADGRAAPAGSRSRARPAAAISTTSARPIM